MGNWVCDCPVAQWNADVRDMGILRSYDEQCCAVGRCRRWPVLITDPAAPSWWRPRAVSTLTLATFAVFVIWSLIGLDHDAYSARMAIMPAVCMLTVLLILVGLWDENGLMSRLLSVRPLVLLGQVSYSLYLWHPIPQFLLTPQSLPLGKPVLGVIGVAWTVVATLLTYRYLEKPFIRSRGSVIKEPAELGADSAIDLRTCTIDKDHHHFPSKPGNPTIGHSRSASTFSPGFPVEDRTGHS